MGPSQDEITRAWFSTPDTLNILLIGNSHSKDLFNALYLNAERFPGMAFARFGMKTLYPKEQRAILYNTPNFIAADVVLVAPRYNGAFAEHLPGFLKELQDQGKRVVLVDNTAELISPGTLPITDWYIHRYHVLPEADVLNARAYKAQSNEVAERNATLSAIAQQAGVPLLSRWSLVCDDTAESCTVLTPNRRKAMYDYGHWTLDGAKHFGHVAAERDWLGFLRKPF